MLRKLVEFHEIDPEFLELPLSFLYRTTDEEQSFCVPWTVKGDDDYSGMWPSNRRVRVGRH
jgi:hypothetical protein